MKIKIYADGSNEKSGVTYYKKMKKNLIFYCYIHDIDNINLATTINLKSIEKWKYVFDGQIIIYLAIDEIFADSLEKAKNIFNFFDDCYIKIVKNQTDHRESEYFIDMIKEIKDINTLTFF